MDSHPEIICIGSAHWDLIGACSGQMPRGADLPGAVMRRPGGVALNIATELARAGKRPVLLAAVGCDPAGDELLEHCARSGIDVRLMLRSRDWPTGSYLAIEAAGSLVGAIADLRVLEQTQRDLVALLPDACPDPHQTVVVDGNLAPETLGHMARATALRACDLRVAAASPAKAPHLLTLLDHERLILYLNLAEAAALCATRFADTGAAADALRALGAARVLVTNGAGPCCDADARAHLRATPPAVTARRATGAGDAFLAAHLVAEIGGAARDEALGRALAASADHVGNGTTR